MKEQASKPSVASLLIVDLQSVLKAPSDSHAKSEPFESGSEQDEGEDPPSSQALVPSFEQFENWANKAYSSVSSSTAELSIRLVCREEMEQLNHAYRGQVKATNVLSFPVELDINVAAELGRDLLGDVVICHEVVCQEAVQQEKSVSDHYAHLVTHGVLHLCGHDHQDDEEAALMESLEMTILEAQGVKNPYA